MLSGDTLGPYRIVAKVGEGGPASARLGESRASWGGSAVAVGRKSF